MGKMKFSGFIFLLLILVAGCEKSQQPSNEVVKYVCLDGSTANNLEDCSPLDKTGRRTGNEASGKISPQTMEEPIPEKPVFTILQHNSKQEAVS